MDQEDIVIYLILTQAARTIQRGYRAYMARKKLAKSREAFRSEIESELE